MRNQLRHAAPVIGLGVLGAAIALSGVGIVASGAADPNHPAASLRAAVPAPAASVFAPPPTTGAVQPPLSPGVEPSTVASTPGPTESSVATGSTAAATASAAETAPTSAATKPATTRSTAAARKTAKPTTTKTAKPTASATTSGVSAAAVSPPAADTVGAKPGSYAQTSNGTIVTSFGSMPVSGSATLTVGSASGQMQTQTTTDGNNSEVEKLVFGAKEVDATELSITSEVLDSDFVLAPQEPLVELTPGATWSWKADSTDGKEHLALTGSYAGTETVVVGGVTETAAIIKSTLTVTGSVATTITQTDDYDPDYRLVLREHQVAKGTYKGFAYNADVTTTLNSLTPS